MTDSGHRQRVATVGTFDGVHKGHRLVIDTLKKLAEESGASPLVFTFNRHPLCIIAPARAPKRIMSAEDEVMALRSLGVGVRVLTFDERLRSMKAREWLAALKEKHNVAALVMGFDNTFGSDGIDFSLADYKRIGEETGVPVHVAGRLPGVSSSIVRKSILDGNVEKAAEMLGAPFSLSGRVVPGKALGRRIGFPTANLQPGADRLIPGPSVYAAFASTEKLKNVPAVVNIGIRPTVSDDGHISIEAHLIGLNEDLYGKELRLSFMRRLRDEEHFASLDDLTAAISSDRTRALEILRDFKDLNSPLR